MTNPDLAVTLGLAVALTLSALPVPGPQRIWGAGPVGAQTSVGLHVVAVDPEPGGGSVTTLFADGRLDRGGAWGEWDWRVEGSLWLDLGEPEASVLGPVEATLRREWDRFGLRVGVGVTPWGLSALRSPAAMLNPMALLWSSVSVPTVGNPLVELSSRVGGTEVDLVLLPLRSTLQQGRLADVTWDGRRLEIPERWEVEAGYGFRLWRSFEAVDVGLWWMDASDRRPWITPLPVGGMDGGGSAPVRHPRTRQLGYAMEWVLGPTVVRSEGALAHREGGWHSRALLGVEWFATPYLTLLLEQGLASDRDEAASPLVDDTLLGLQLVTETTRLRGGLAVDAASGTRHLWSTVRWTATDRWAVELEWLDAWGAPGAETSAALRQPRALRLGGVRYF